MRLVTAVPWLQGITARFVGLGVRPEHVQSPDWQRISASRVSARDAAVKRCLRRTLQQKLGCGASGND